MRSPAPRSVRPSCAAPWRASHTRRSSRRSRSAGGTFGAAQCSTAIAVEFRSGMMVLKTCRFGLVRPEPLHRLLVKRGLLAELRDDHAKRLDRLADVVGECASAVADLRNAVRGEVIGNGRDDEPVRDPEAVERDDRHARRAVDEHPVVLVDHRVDRPPQDVGRDVRVEAARSSCQTLLEVDQVEARRQEIEPAACRPHRRCPRRPRLS